MRIQHNIMALNSQRQLGINNSNISKSLEKLSSGYRINRAGDDAAGLAISEKMRAQIKGLETATDNANDAISLIQTAEGGLQEVHSMLNRMTELATKSANGTYDDDVDRQALQDEYDALLEEIDRIADSTNFNGIKLLDGSIGNEHEATGLVIGGATYTIGAGADFDQTVEFAQDDGKTGGGIIVDIDSTSGAVTITLGSSVDTRYSTADIEAAVKAKAASMLKEAPAAALKSKLEALSTFSISGGGDITAVNGGNLSETSGALTTPAAGARKGIMTLQIGDTNDTYNQLKLAINDMHSAALGVTTPNAVKSRENAGASIDIIKTAINQVSTQRGKLGAVQNRLEHTINNLGVTTENITAAESRIRDVDMAKEMMTFTKNSVLQQSAQAMLAQANQQPQSVLQLLQ